MLLLRFWDLKNDVNYVLNIVEASEGLSLQSLVQRKRATPSPSSSGGKQSKWGTIKSNIKGIAQSTICSVAFNQKRGTLAVGTRSGHLLMWRFLGYISSNTTGPKSWQLMYHSKLGEDGNGGSILGLNWAQRHLLSVQLEGSRVFVLNETSLHSCSMDRSVVVQTSPNSLTISAIRRPPAFSSQCRIRLVLPAPRNPVTTVTGTF